MKRYCFTYFSYKKDFPLLKASIESVHKFCPNAEVAVVEDPDSPFTSSQKDWLDEICLTVFKHPLGHSPANGNGKDAFIAQIESFFKVSKLQTFDYIVKIDSDTLLCSDSFEQRIRNESASFVGNHVAYKGESEYIYGNLYLISPDLVRTIRERIQNEPALFDALNDDCRRYFAENRVIYGIVNLLKEPKVIYPHDKGYVYNIDTVSNYRISSATGTDFISGYDLEDAKRFGSIHLWSSQKLCAYYLNSEHKKFFFELTKKNIKNLMVNVKYFVAKNVKKLF
ncbi:hypothetical protein A7985_17320 [Pseudoalteromonas luteoviolacea]|uniref:Uncharacterized protein n=1 Tax=Pseudoalteromonas luteoviolacea TaxID=43657 RepID=A0A1C0TN38_9GAMM|nr:hypothetical protein [Pseudoalteromonas luteoviolacea]OCQ20191.1 hypothetical protein A7985_17320 [Pseudoalteromonas luteoviolacea]